MSKLKGNMNCPKCGSICDCELWQNNGNLYETLICVTCCKEYGRVNGGSWHALEDIECHV